MSDLVTIGSSKGVEREFSISIDRLLEMEAADPSFNLADEIGKLSSFRLTDAVRMCELLGVDYAGFVADGFTYKDLMTIGKGVLRELGFIPDSPRRSESPVQDASEAP